MDEITLVIIITFVGFVTLAAILLVPVYRFLRREEKVSRKFTREAIARRNPATPPNGQDGDDESQSFGGGFRGET